MRMGDVVVPLVLAGALAIGFSAGRVEAKPRTEATQVKLDKDQAALFKAEADFEKARAEKGLAGWLSFFADDTLDLTPGAPIARGKATMRQRLSKHWSADDVLQWQPQHVDVAASHDLAYTTGTWQFSSKSKPGAVIATGKYLTVWRKQKDGSWKAVADIGNDDPPKKKED